MSYLKITQRGTDIERAADYQTVLDSRWPLLEIWQEKQIDVTFIPVAVNGTFDTQLLFSHDIGSLPGWEFYQDTSVVDAAYASALSDYGIVVTKDAVYAENFWVTGDPTVRYRLKGMLRLYLTDFTNTYKADTLTIAPEPTKHGDGSGLKIVEQNTVGASMRKSDYINFSLNTDAKAMSIHMMGSQAPDGTTHYVDLTHGLGYLPTFMAWQISLGVSPTLSTKQIITAVDVASFANTTTLSLRGVQSTLTNTVAYLILKDPLVIAE